VYGNVQKENAAARKGILQRCLPVDTVENWDVVCEALATGNPPPRINKASFAIRCRKLQASFAALRTRGIGKLQGCEWSIPRQGDAMTSLAEAKTVFRNIAAAKIRTRRE